MKSKISVNIDTELLDIIKDYSDADLDSIIQDALAKFFGVKQVWVRTDILDPIKSISKMSVKESNNITEEMDDTKDTVHIKRRRKPKFILKIWDKLKAELGEEFTIDEYWEVTKKCGFNYKDSARHSTIPGHLQLIEDAGKIIKVKNEKPKTYKKSESELNKKSESELYKKSESELKSKEL